MKDDQVARVHERLVARAELCPVALGEGLRFGLWDLASLAEGALDECVGPESLTVSSEKRWRLRLGSDGREPRHDDDFRRRYWICSPDGGRGGPMGTIAVDTWPVGAGAVRISSLYVHPVARRQGIASAEGCGSRRGSMRWGPPGCRISSRSSSPEATAGGCATVSRPCDAGTRKFGCGVGNRAGGSVSCALSALSGAPVIQRVTVPALLPPPTYSHASGARS
ncbi:GNAT family N-acetyltransferase [Streptomyces sp. HC307]|uniref:GNAT family N-acetyltransferase n=1 Tax=Streptomyces flavusporus TaxID=3385496 RepID=UPI003916DD09